MSEKLNELRKATMASYLAKAGKVIRADTSIAASFDDDVYKHMRVANDNHPNVINGKEKDPEKLAHAQQQMKVNADLRDTFKRSASNRIKGIALAGRRLAKEEAIVEAGKNPYGPGYKLVDKEGKQLHVGHKFKDEDGEHHEVTGWQSGAQRGNSSSSGRVAVKVGKGKKAYHTEYFPHVFDFKVVKEDVEQVDEVSRSTIAKVATARYNQAQDALKKKDFGGYVKKMGKAIKAGNATTPVTGWSPEDDNTKRNEEVEQVFEGIGTWVVGKAAKYGKVSPKSVADNFVQGAKNQAKGTKWADHPRFVGALNAAHDHISSAEDGEEAVKKMASAPDVMKKHFTEEAPVLSAQEKYRQIKEAKLAKSAKSTTTHHNYYIYHDDLAKSSSALKKAGIPHHVADHSKAPVEHSVISVRYKHTEKADEVLKKNKINYGGR